MCVCVSYTGGFIGGRRVYVGHWIQDVEGNESDLVEPITTLPPALGRLDHLSGGGAAVSRHAFGQSELQGP